MSSGRAYLRSSCSCSVVGCRAIIFVLVRLVAQQLVTGQGTGRSSIGAKKLSFVFTYPTPRPLAGDDLLRFRARGGTGTGGGGGRHESSVIDTPQAVMLVLSVGQLRRRHNVCSWWWWWWWCYLCGGAGGGTIDTSQAVILVVCRLVGQLSRQRMLPALDPLDT